MPETANNLEVKARQLCCPAIGVSQVSSTRAGIGEGSGNRSDTPVKGRLVQVAGHHARHIKKTSFSRVRENRKHGLKGG
jgi:hypothetical protein